ncbi:hypothetical protein DFH08DRAFT_1017798 [Mycena albidolilacea]|uniref:Uncharacterized protein n=1 Tax=Mycena albidolilacea TaxID=1033008 RepID=A0AAD7EL97_9AGAR|nr:hypothetical protein DFH08DRAFT_1017798 [Mycena albidolilacea]
MHLPPDLDSNEAVRPLGRRAVHPLRLCILHPSPRRRRPASSHFIFASSPIDSARIDALLRLVSPPHHHSPHLAYLVATHSSALLRLISPSTPICLVPAMHCTCWDRGSTKYAFQLPPIRISAAEELQPILRGASARERTRPLSESLAPTLTCLAHLGIALAAELALPRLAPPLVYRVDTQHSGVPCPGIAALGLRRIRASSLRVGSVFVDDETLLAAYASQRKDQHVIGGSVLQACVDRTKRASRYSQCRRDWDCLAVTYIANNIRPSDMHAQDIFSYMTIEPNAPDITQAPAFSPVRLSATAQSRFQSNTCRAVSSSALHATSASTTCNSTYSSASGRRSPPPLLSCQARKRILKYASLSTYAKPSARRLRLVLPAVCECDCAPALPVCPAVVYIWLQQRPWRPTAARAPTPADLAQPVGHSPRVLRGYVAFATLHAELVLILVPDLDSASLVRRELEQVRSWVAQPSVVLDPGDGAGACRAQLLLKSFPSGRASATARLPRTRACNLNASCTSGSPFLPSSTMSGWALAPAGGLLAQLSRSYTGYACPSSFRRQGGTRWARIVRGWGSLQSSCAISVLRDGGGISVARRVQWEEWAEK